MPETSQFLFLRSVNMSGAEANASVAPSVEPAGGICPAWLNINHYLFQTANFFLLLSYLIPGGPYALLQLRVVIGLGSFFFALWGYVILCAFDTLVWNALFTLINLVHICVLVRGMQRVSFTTELEAVFEDLFRPLGVMRHQFQGVAACVGETRELGDREVFAVQKVSRNDNLSLVVSGNLLVTENQRPLQQVGKYEFLESPEWFVVPESDLYQVTATALGACKVVVWKRETLRMALGEDSHLKAAFDELVGKAVARKLKAVMIKPARRSISGELFPPEVVKELSSTNRK
ncbi:hypothetical protein HPB47_001492 [Ixodes persulcatus]|uniref:Uncharacterized protein n=1 Tax=Ixodes persulcatus TaxID=34615 RepID=A0AC60PNV4_IXOPE|nr:hypothetical protein HPB47_001492 [Ixodes persulcatus]